MAFSEEVIDKAFAKSGGKCECTRQHAGQTAPHHGGKCPRATLRYGLGEPHHIKMVKDGGNDLVENCEFICLECYTAANAAVPAAR